jgi:serine/threonine protein kinase
MSQLVETEDILSSQKIKGSPLYMAPEVIQRKGITFKADVYSFGICKNKSIIFFKN